MKRIVIALALILLAGSVAVGSSLALFSDQEAILGNTISTGTLQLTLNKSAGKPYGVTNAYPGYLSTVEYMDVFNSGTLPFEAVFTPQYASGDTPLYNFLRLKLWTDIDSNCSTMGWGEHVIWDGLMSTMPSTTVSSQTYWGHGNESDGSGPNDNVRVGWSVRLCQQVGVDNSADNSVMGKSVVFNEVVDAVQDND